MGKSASRKVTMTAKLLLAFVVAAATMTLSGVANAQCQRGTCCTVGTSGPNGDQNFPVALQGDTVTIAATIGNANSGCVNESIIMSNVHISVFHADGTVTTGNLLPTPRTLTVSGNCAPLGNPLQSIDFVTNTIVNAADAAAGFLTVQIDFDFIEVLATGQRLPPLHNQCSSTVTIFHPCLDVTKLVACRPPGGDCSLATYCKKATGFIDGQPEAAFCYSVTTTNCGDTDLTITTVNDNVFGDLTSLIVAANGGTAFPVGKSVTFFFDELESGGKTNTVTVNATESVDGTSLSASDSATTVVFRASIKCRKLVSLNGGAFVENDTLVIPSGHETDPLTYRVIVTNDGTAKLMNVSASDPVVTGINFTGRTLNAGQSTTNDFTTTANAVAHCDQNCANSLENTITVSGVVPNDQNNCICGIGVNGEPVTATSTCTVNIQCSCNPGIQIIKEVTCLTASGCPPAGDASYSNSATGVVDSVFCYSLTVLNTGTVDLVNIVVTDTTAGGPVDALVSSCFPTAFSLPAGASTNCIHSTSYPGVIGNVPDSVRAVGQDSAGNMVNSSDNASVRILPIPLNCDKRVSSDGVTFVKSLDLGEQNTPQSVTWRLTVTNPNSFPLQNVIITEVASLPGGTLCSTNGDPVSFPLTVAFLDAGDTITILCTGTVNCPDTTVNSFSVQGEVSPTTAICAIGEDFLPVKSDICTSQASVTCRPPVVAGCRTTGGGKQPTENTCEDANDRRIRYVTHGGQVGAAFGVASAPDCALDIGFNNECIRGEFQHVRHIKGGLRGNFHAAGNGHQHDFDSLMCACLPCAHVDTASPFGGCHPADRCYAGEDGQVNGLCHPGERLCGPEPRKAPSNKICFSGVADYTMSNGRKTPQSVVFRVDLEDRGEPGNAHALGHAANKLNPPDRYRMRMWFIAADSANTPAIKALRATVACRASGNGSPLCEILPTVLDCTGTATPAPDIDDGGDLDRGNRQIHPNTGATCH